MNSRSELQTAERAAVPSLLAGLLLVSWLVAPGPGARAEPETWDQRLDGLGVYHEEAEVPAGSYYWRLIEAFYEDEQEAAGTHHIFFRVLDSDGQPIEGQRVWQAWPTGNPTEAVPAETKGPLDQYWGNHALFGGSWCPAWPEGGHGPYGAYVDGPSDEVWGMGLPCNRHVSFRLIWQWTKSAGSEKPPAISVTPATLSAGAPKGTSPPDGLLQVRNSGEGSLRYTISADVSWLEVSPSEGASSGEADTVVVEYRTASLETGVHRATITIRDPEASNTPQTVEVTLTITPGEPSFTRGDANIDGSVDISDAVAVLMHLFLGAGSVACEDAADANDDGQIDISDPVTVLNALFVSGDPLLPVCGLDATDDGLGCEAYPDC